METTGASRAHLFHSVQTLSPSWMPSGFMQRPSWKDTPESGLWLPLWGQLAVGQAGVRVRRALSPLHSMLFPGGCLSI